jgi:hypothetical protein
LNATSYLAPEIHDEAVVAGHPASSKCRVTAQRRGLVAGGGAAQRSQEDAPDVGDLERLRPGVRRP